MSLDSTVFFFSTIGKLNFILLCSLSHEEQDPVCSCLCSSFEQFSNIAYYNDCQMTINWWVKYLEHVTRARCILRFSHLI